jgi:hypothetical protein
MATSAIGRGAGNSDSITPYVWFGHTNRWHTNTRIGARCPVPMSTPAQESPLDFIALLPEDGSNGGNVDGVMSSGAAQSDLLAPMATETAAKHWSTTRRYHSIG